MSATAAMATLLASEYSDSHVRVDSLLTCIELLDAVYDQEDKNRRLTLQLADARTQLADARTRLERCPLHRFQSWLRSVTWRDR
jgi:hypothetical protein